MKYIPLLLILICSTVYAGTKERSRAIELFAEKGRPSLNSRELSDLSDRGYIDRRTGTFDPPVSSLWRPADYVSDVKRGTIEYDPKWRNYSYHKVLIPDGTVIDGEVLGACNFVQIAPDTDAIIRAFGFGHDLTFKDCNLSNVRTYDDWTLISCNTTQADKTGKFNADGSVDVENMILVGRESKEVDKDRVRPNRVLE